jgi:hypothetical protein
VGSAGSGRRVLAFESLNIYWFFVQVSRFHPTLINPH